MKPSTHRKIVTDTGYRNPIKYTLVKLYQAILKWIWNKYFKNYHTHAGEKARRVKQMEGKNERRI